ncbi:9141_t:CDS:2, partial [Gigaspora rosea]
LCPSSSLDSLFRVSSVSADALVYVPLPPCISQITAFARLLLIIPKDENLISKDAAPLVNVLNKEEYPSIVDNGTCACLTFFGLTILSLLDEKNIGSSGTYISILLSKLSNKFLDVSSLKTFLQRFPVKSPKYSPGTSMFTFIKGSSNTSHLAVAPDSVLDGLD